MTDRPTLPSATDDNHRPRRSLFACRSALPLLGAWAQLPDARARLGFEACREVITGTPSFFALDTTRALLAPYSTHEGERELIAKAASFSESDGVPYWFAIWMSAQFGGNIDRMRASLSEARRLEAEARAAGAPPLTPLEGEDWSRMRNVDAASAGASAAESAAAAEEQ